MLGILMSVIAGAAMSFQGVMNTRLSEKIGLYEANTFVQGTALVLSLLIALLFGSGSIGKIIQVKWLYWLGGVLGTVITVAVMLGIHDLSPTVSISIILIAQLSSAALIDAFGLMESEKVPICWTQAAGLALMIGGVVLFKVKS